MGKISQPKIILITGCSSGFGLLIAARLTASGHTVIASMRDLQKAGRLFDDVRRRGSQTNPELLQLDVTSKASIQKATLEIADKYGYVDVLVNNAGYGIGGCFEDLTEEDIRNQFETNFFGVQNVTRAILPLMRPRRGKIINISSLAGLSGSPGLGAYNASKWALEGFTESLRYELSLFGIDVHLVEPGTYKTKIFYENARYATRFYDERSPYYSVSKILKEATDTYVDNCKRDPEDVAIVVERLIESSSAPFRNLTNPEGQMMHFLRRFLPFSLYSAIIKKALLDKVEPSGRNPLRKQMDKVGPNL